MAKQETDPDNVKAGGGAMPCMPPWDLGDNRFMVVWQKFMQSMVSQPQVLADITRQHTDKQLSLLSTFTNGAGDDKAPTPPPAGRPDARFNHPQWEVNPFYKYLKESYVNNSALLLEVAKAVELEGDDRRALDFILKQLISAMAPTNFPATNPEVAEATIETKGENLLRGMENYLTDLQAGSITQTDPDAFVVGEQLALTPGKVIAQNHLMQLIEYSAATTKVHARPVLVIPPCINKYYILDLKPDNSFIRHLVAKGLRVFLVSWINAGPKQAQMTWDDYVTAGVMEAAAKVCEVTGQERINSLGYCIGGTLLACAVAVMRANGDERIATMSLLTAFLDFCDTGDIGLFVDEKMVATTECKYANGGLLSGADLHRTFAYLRPDDLIWPYVVRNYMLGQTPPAFDILHWNSDSTNLPGRMYAWYLRHTYLANDLKDGDVTVCGCKINFKKLNIPGMVISCERDHIVPWQAAYASARLLGPKVSFVLSSAGHVAGIVNPPARKKGYHLVAPKAGAGALPADPEQWRATAGQTTGSWWNHFAAWLAKNGGPKVEAPKRPGDYRHLAIEDAPGSYVTAPLTKVN